MRSFDRRPDDAHFVIGDVVGVIAIHGEHVGEIGIVFRIDDKHVAISRNEFGDAVIR